MSSRYRYVLEVRSPEGHILHQQGVEPDWEPAIEAARLAGLRSFGLWFQAGGRPPVIDPVWATPSGAPVIRAFAVRLEQAEHAWSVELPAVHYLGDVARAAVAAKVTAGVLSPGDRVHYLVAAYEQSDMPAPPARVRFAVTDQPLPCPATDRPFGDLLDRSLVCGDPDPADVGVVIPERVLDEVCALTVEAGECETGGILLGHLCRDSGGGEVGLEVTAQIAARHTAGDSTKVTFTSDTWTDVRAAVDLRRADELIAGYWHSHPAFSWCSKCPAERQEVCQLGTGFLSADDKALHRVMFPAAYTQALVVTRSIKGLEAKLFGWRGGVLEPRGFHMLPNDAPLARARDAVRRPVPTTTAEACDEGAVGPIGPVGPGPAGAAGPLGPVGPNNSVGLVP